MDIQMRKIALHTTCVLSERWSVEPFKGQFPDPQFFDNTVTYEVAFSYKPYSIVEDHNQTVILFEHIYLFMGEDETFAEWGRSAGGAKIARDIYQLVNRLIDIVQTSFEETEDNPYPHLRHVGFRDFVLMDSLFGERRQNLISYAMLGLDARFAKRSIGIISKVNFMIEESISNEKTKILRAVELLNSGYHTEALLISYSLLDHSVQEAICNLIGDRGINNPKGFLKSILGNRLKTFMGPLLKVLTGHSLEEENNDLWKNLGECNSLRNQAIHNSIDVSYDKAKLTIETLRDILIYLNSISKREPHIGTTEPVFANLNIKNLPFLMEYK